MWLSRLSKKLFSQRARRVDCYPTEHLTVTPTKVRAVARDQRDAQRADLRLGRAVRLTTGALVPR